ncbi:MAG: bifunctional DNA-binding transcriptional regulator/O6-methylguanine-DNA methyltransferase Ada [Chloroflexota bacterium]|nr:bifunctional DNA-binding transcriptional regulator/O6-methylguanine-DNA methyltransferase Ada [Chloroflexota bacterium]
MAAAEWDSRWSHVVARDPAADGTFWYSVATTGIYCRPSCPSRTANPKNVRFHDSLAEAKAAGFRACKRCKPDQPSADARNAATVAHVCRLIERTDEILPLTVLAEAAGLSAGYFHRIFKTVTGLTPQDYAVAHRAGKVRDQLSRSSTVTAAIYDAGFNSSGRFYAKSDELLGMTPSAFRAGGVDVEIRFAVGECSLGSILAASSEKGVCAILIGDDPNALVRDLQDRFPHARLIGGDADFEKLMARVVGFVEAPGIGLDLPLDVRGTAFQQRVWAALRGIPAGTTVTYGDIARTIGKPKAVRAVAGACAANMLAVAIPCHRVVKRDGALTGYRWGVERKRALIEREAKAA